MYPADQDIATICIRSEGHLLSTSMKVNPGTYRESTTDCGSRSYFLYALCDLVIETVLESQTKATFLVMVKKLLGGLITFCMLLTLFPLTGCSKDDDADGLYGGYVLTVNGKKWDSGITAPNYDEDGFYFYCQSPDGHSHTLFFDEDLTDEDLEKDDDVSPDYLVLLSENAKYRYEDGDVIVTKIKGTNVTLKFDNYKVKYVGKWESLLDDSRNPDIANATTLTINGTVTFIFHP